MNQRLKLFLCLTAALLLCLTGAALAEDNNCWHDVCFNSYIFEDAEYSAIYGSEHYVSGIPVADGCFCRDCGALLNTGDAPSELWSGLQEHRFVDGVCACGYEDKCDHPESVWVCRLTDGKYAGSYGRVHYAEGTLAEGYCCSSCGDMLTQPGYVYETTADNPIDHAFINGMCECGYRKHCDHTEKLSTYMLLDGEYTASYGGMHAIQGTYGWCTVCTDCGEIMEQPSYVQDSCTTELEHVFINGVCPCGYEKHCEHETRWMNFFDGAEYTAIYGRQHVGEGPLYSADVCRLCGETWRQPELQHKSYSGSVDHRFINGVCDCGYTRTDCLHENEYDKTRLTRLSTEYFNVFAQKHSVRIQEQYEYLCSNCDELLYAPNIDNYTISQTAHTFTDGVCECGYVKKADCSHVAGSRYLLTDAEFTDIYGSTHTGTGRWEYIYYCTKCEEILYQQGLSRDNETVTEDHLLLNGKCICGYTTDCNHKEQHVQGLLDAEYFASYGIYHYGYGDYADLYICTRCGELTRAPEIIEKDFDGKLEHVFINGVCECGYKQNCDHGSAGTYGREVLKNATYSSVYGSYHTGTGEVWQIDVCLRCGEICDSYQCAQQITIKDKHFFVDGVCDCGYKQTCDHDVFGTYGREILKNATYSSVYGSYHTGTGDVWQVDICLGCGEICDSYQCAQNITLKDKHFFTDGVCDCGYEQACDHDAHGTYSRETLHNATYSSVYGAFHTGTGEVWQIDVCMECGEVCNAYMSDSQLTFKEPHFFVDGVCECSYEYHCDHNSDICKEHFVSPVYTVSLRKHTVSGKYMREWFCSDCGEATDGYVVYENLTRTEDHNFENGKCVCGAEFTCDHDAYGFDTKVTYENIADLVIYARMHSFTADHVTKTFCRGCGAVENAVVYPERETVNDWHNFVDGKCVDCGYEPTCPHDGGESFILENYTIHTYDKHYGGWHYGYGTWEYAFSCDLCGMQTVPLITEENIYRKQEHTFTDGVCECGYRQTCTHPEESVKKYDAVFANSYMLSFGQKHYGVGQHVDMQVCTVCNEYLYYDVLEENYAGWGDHVFVNGKCDCGYVFHCEHEPYNQFHLKNQKIVNNGDGTHTVTGQHYWSPECDKCGEYMYESLMDANYKYTGAHSFYGETSDYCACGEKNPCDHSKTGISDVKYAESYQEIDDLQHAVYGSIHHDVYCDECYILLSAAHGTKIIEDQRWIERHEFDYFTGKCNQCGFVNPCTHENLTEEWVPTYDQTEGETIDINFCTVTMTERLKRACPDCGTSDWSEVRQVPVVIGHVYFHWDDDGYIELDSCRYCGHPKPVNPPLPTSIEILAGDSLTFERSESIPVDDLEVRVLPEGALYELSWDYDYEKMHNDLWTGTLTATVSTQNGCKDSIRITIVDNLKPTGIQIHSEDHIYITEGYYIRTPAVSILPETAVSWYNWDWSKDDYVDFWGDAMQGIKPGTVTGTVKTRNGKTDSIKVTVVPVDQPVEVRLNKTGTQILSMGDSLLLDFELLPFGTWCDFTYSSSDPKVAKVGADGMVDPVSEGTATITITTANGKKASVTVQVVDPFSAAAVQIDQDDMDLRLDDFTSLSATVLPETAETELTWSVSDETLAEITEDGILYPKKPGVVTVTVTTSNGKTDSIKVNIFDPYAPTGITLDKTDTVRLGTDDTLTLLAALQPEEAISDLTWTSSNEKVATVADGVVTPLQEGTATITVSTYNGYTASVKINVFDPYKPEGITLSHTGTVQLSLAETLPLLATLQPETAKSELTWSTTSSAILTVDENGLVTPHKEGTATVTVATYNGKTASVKITVFDPTKATSVAFDHEATVEIDLFDDPMQLNAVMQPETATSALTWKSSSTKIVTVDENGVITPIKEGSATITVTTSTGKKATQKIKVVDNHKPASVVLSKEGTIEISMFDDVLNLDAQILPETAISGLTWSTSSSKIAAVDADGVVTPIKEGTATITVKTRNGKSDTVKVKIVDNYKPTAVVLDEAGPITISLYDDPMQLGASLQPETAVSNLTWTSSSTKIATVDENGIVTPIKEGSATITVKTRNGKSDTVKVNIIDPYKPTAVVLNQEGTVPVYLGDNLCLTADLQPETARSNLTWTSSSTKIATVDENGVITPIKEGTATITVKTHNGKSDTVKVAVTDPKKAFSITLDQTGTVICDLNGTLALNATMEPATAESVITWSSSNKKIATVDENGVVTGLKEGTVTITVKTSNGKSDSVKVTVNDPKKAVSVTLDREGTIDLIAFDDVLQLSAEMLPVTAEGSLMWKSSSTKIATVDENGLVTPIGAGTATITVKTSNGKTDTVKVKVTDPYLPKSVTLEQEGTVEVRLFEETLQLDANLSEGARSDLTWSTSSAKIATVDENGEVTPVGEGTATITVKTRNGKKDTVKVKVIDNYKPTAVVLDEAGTITANIGEPLPLHADIQPTTAISGLTWKTSSAKIATVDENGVVTGLKEGTVTITVTTRNGKKDTVKVQIVDPKKATAVTLDKEGTIELPLNEKLQLNTSLTPVTAETTLKWSTSSSKIATVNADGLVTPVKTGTVTIKVTTANGKSDSVKIKVVAATTAE